MIDADGDAFAGKTPITCKPGPVNHDGVTILIAAEPNENFIAAANRAALYLPIEVHVDGVVAERRDFLAGADHIEDWNGIRIGLFETSPTAFRNDGNVNFHGVTLQAALPHITQCFHRAYYARIEVIDCPDLKLVLPARKEVVANAFFDALKQQILRIMFERINASGAHSLLYANWERAQALGVDLPPAAQPLRPFSPSQADRDQNAFNRPVPLRPDDLLFDGDDSPIGDQNLAMALSGLEDSPRLLEPNGLFAGYEWYDALPCLALGGYRLAHATGTERLPLDANTLTHERPERLFIEGQIGTVTDLVPWELETDVLILGEDHCHIDEVDICVTSSSKVTHDDLIDLVKRALFCRADDVDAVSYDEQERWFTDEAEDRMITLLKSNSEANINAVIRTVARELYWLCKPKSDVTIRILDGQVSVEGMDASEDAIPSELTA